MINTRAPDGANNNQIYALEKIHLGRKLYNLILTSRFSFSSLPRLKSDHLIIEALEAQLTKILFRFDRNDPDIREIVFLSTLSRKH